MIKGLAARAMQFGGWQILLCDRENRQAYTIKFESHSVIEGMIFPTTDISGFNNEMDILRGLAEALREMGLFPMDATQSELVATKYHLEDMRKIARVSKESK